MTRTPDSSYSKKYLTQKFFESQKTRSSKNVPKIRKFALILELPVAFNLDIPYNLDRIEQFRAYIRNQKTKLDQNSVIIEKKFFLVENG